MRLLAAATWFAIACLVGTGALLARSPRVQLALAVLMALAVLAFARLVLVILVRGRRED